MNYGHNERLKNEKALYDMRHAIQRAKERYGLRLSEREYWTLVDQCIAGSAGPAKFLARSTNTSTTWRVWHGTMPMIAVYIRTTKTIRTFLPANGYIDRRRMGDIQTMRRVS